jgi:hypothetical protein
LIIANFVHLFVLGSSLEFSWLGGRREVGKEPEMAFRLSRWREGALTLDRLLLAEQTRHGWSLGRLFVVASLNTVSSLDGRNLIARGSHFGRVRNDTAAFVIALGKDAMGEILARRGDGRKRQDGVFSTGNSGRQVDSRARPGPLGIRLVSEPRTIKLGYIPDPSRVCGNLHS